MKEIIINRSIIIVLVVTILMGCKKEEVPILTTSAITNVTGASAICGGTITDEGSSTIIARGVCWSTGTTPTIADNKTTNGAGAGSFISSINGLNGGTTFYVRAYATNSEGNGYGTVVSFKTFGQAPTAITQPATNVTTGATLNGTVNPNYLSTTISFEYGTTLSYGSSIEATSSPMTGNTSMSVSANISGLTSGTIYHFRIKAINTYGTIYGNDMPFATDPLTVNDVDGNIYNVIRIGTQLWMKENLKTTKYRNGDIIGTTTPATLNISSESTPKYQWAPNGNEGNVPTYGRLYTWYAITDSRNVCPIGWHVPTIDECTILENYLTNNGYGYGGSGSDIAKSLAATSGWISDPAAGTVGNDQSINNSSSFTNLPSGDRLSSGSFSAFGIRGYWWSTKEYSVTHALGRGISNYGSYVGGINCPKGYGLPVRCIKD